MKILSIDGGGVFGAIPAYYLSKVDISPVDVIAGTSIGSVLALGYASRVSTEEMYSIFRSNIKRIFGEKNFIFVKGPKFKDRNLNKVLVDVIIGRVKNLSKKVIVPTFDVTNNCPKIYNNLCDRDLEEISWEVARKSCSAPTYFSSWKGFIDGGIIANNPSHAAIGSVIRNLGIRLSDIEVFSIGTGDKPPVLSRSNINDWYRWQWLEPMLDMLTTGNEIMVDSILKNMPLKKYVRFNPVILDENWNFTDSSKVQEAVDRASAFDQDFLTAYENFLK